MKKKMLHEYTLKRLLIEEDLMEEGITDVIAKPMNWMMRQIQKVFPQTKTAKQEGINDEDLLKLMKKYPLWGIVYDLFEKYNTSWIRTFEKTYRIDVGKQFPDAPVISAAIYGSLTAEEALDEIIKELNHPEYGAAMRAPYPDHNPAEAPPPIERDQLMAAFALIGACMTLNRDEPQKSCIDFLTNLGGGGGGIGDYVGPAAAFLGLPILAPLLPANLAVLGSVLAYAAVVGMLAGQKGQEIDKEQLDVIMPIFLSLLDEDGNQKLSDEEAKPLPNYAASDSAQKLVDAWVMLESKVIPSLLKDPYKMPDMVAAAKRALSSEFNLLYFLELIEDEEEMKDKFDEVFAMIQGGGTDYDHIKNRERFGDLEKRRNEKIVKNFNDKYGKLQDITDEELSDALGEALNRAIRIIQMEDRE